MSSPTVHRAKRPAKELLLDRDACIDCAGCVGTCPHFALDMFGTKLQIFQDECTYCTICVRFCPTGALSIVKKTVEGPTEARQGKASH